MHVNLLHKIYGEYTWIGIKVPNKVNPRLEIVGNSTVLISKYVLKSLV